MTIAEQKITIVDDEEGIFDDYLVVGSLGAFLENINDSESFSNDVRAFTIKEDTFEAINFLKAISYGEVLYCNFRTNLYVYVLCPGLCSYWS